jgi:hypothetical protein
MVAGLVARTVEQATASMATSSRIRELVSIENERKCLGNRRCN